MGVCQLNGPIPKPWHDRAVEGPVNGFLGNGENIQCARKGSSQRAYIAVDNRGQSPQEAAPPNLKPLPSDISIFLDIVVFIFSLFDNQVLIVFSWLTLPNTPRLGRKAWSNAQGKS
jgi:hypothetical protein